MSGALCVTPCGDLGSHRHAFALSRPRRLADLRLRWAPSAGVPAHRGGCRGVPANWDGFRPSWAAGGGQLLRRAMFSRLLGSMCALALARLGPECRYPRAQIAQDEPRLARLTRERVGERRHADSRTLRACTSPSATMRDGSSLADASIRRMQESRLGHRHRHLLSRRDLNLAPTQRTTCIARQARPAPASRDRMSCRLR